jgi:hypothetical protein
MKICFMCIVVARLPLHKAPKRHQKTFKMQIAEAYYMLACTLIDTLSLLASKDTY